MNVYAVTQLLDKDVRCITNGCLSDCLFDAIDVNTVDDNRCSAIQYIGRHRSDADRRFAIFEMLLAQESLVMPKDSLLLFIVLKVDMDLGDMRCTKAMLVDSRVNLVESINGQNALQYVRASKHDNMEMAIKILVDYLEPKDVASIVDLDINDRSELVHIFKHSILLSHF